LKTEEELWSARGRCSALELRKATRGSVMILLHKDLSFIPGSRSDSPEYKLVVKDFKLPSDRSNGPTFRLLALHHHHCRHHKGITMHKILVL
jgi:hypothetical protein